MAGRGDVNIVVISGEVHSQPELHLLKSNQNCLKFKIKTIESYLIKGQQPAQKENFFDVEVLGKTALNYQSNLGVGDFIQITGYLRHDVINSRDAIRIRALHIKESYGNG